MGVSIWPPGVGFIFGGIFDGLSTEGAELPALIGPVSVGDAYNVSNCKNLTSLRGAPQFVNNAFIATQCNLSHFHELAHSKIDRLVLTQNPITSLLGIPTNCYNLRVDYHAQLPLLRVVLPTFPKLILRPPTSDQEDAVEYVRALINFYWKNDA